MTTIQNQVANHFATINNAEQINNIIFNDPLKFYFDKKGSEKPEFELYFKLIKYIVNEDMLKKRFGGINYKYENLTDFLAKYIEKEIAIESGILDDGYKSIIFCIIKVLTYFTFSIAADGNYMVVKNCENLIGYIDNLGLNINYSKNINSYTAYVEAKNIAENIKKELAPYINCATQYGNFFQFNNIIINEIDNVPFITQEIKFNVSNAIIPNLIKPLYGESPECGLREIIQNACDASKEFKEICSKECDLEIEVRLLHENNIPSKIIVRDYGIGMTKEVLINKYFIIGESSKKNSNLNLVGQFGIGALAAFLLGNNVEVRTKSYDKNEIYHFSYTLNPDEDSCIYVEIEEDDKFKHGTEVIINLNENLKNLNKDSLMGKLKLNEWYVLPDIPIKFYIDSEEIQLNTLIGDRFVWQELIDLYELKVKYLKEMKEASIEIENCNSKIIFNGLMIPEAYQFTCAYLKKKPCISICSNNNAIKLNLERSKIESGATDIINKLQQELIADGLNKLRQEANTIVDKNKIIQRFKYDNEYLQDIPLFFCKEGFGIYSTKTIEALLNKYKTTVIVYGYNGYPSISLNDLTDEVIYLFYRNSLERSNLADLIENKIQFKCIPNEKIKSYFYDATNYHNGFRIDTIKKLYEFFQKDLPEYQSVNEFWQKHNATKKNLFENYFNEPQYLHIGNANCNIENIKKICKYSTISSFSFLHKATNIINNDDLDVGVL